ncbi:MAG: phosphoesterase [Chitinophagaceae bacterium]|nr:phosphoesterase [Chitinophagaceae bacterium]
MKNHSITLLLLVTMILLFMRSYFLALFFASISCTVLVNAQPAMYSTANAHSHNDYEQAQPFYLAYQEKFGSIEADIHLVNGKILVGHDAKDVSADRNLEKLYLDPLADFIKRNNGYPYSDHSRTIQLLIDQKTDAVPTLKALIEVLKKYPSIIQNKKITIAISGNRPDPKDFLKYPEFIWFDGRLKENYSKEALSKIALLSDDFSDWVKKKYPLEITTEERENIIRQINHAHEANKKVRFWAVPDYAVAWEKMIEFKVDFINTDHLTNLSDFLLEQNKEQHLMPFNRIIQSAGEVIRFGKPDLENHALDITKLSEKGLMVVEDRYGIVALNVLENKIIDRWTYTDISRYKNFVSTYSGIKAFELDGKTYVLWSASELNKPNAAIMIAEWADGFKNISDIAIEKRAPAHNALPNDLAVKQENGEWFIYAVLNGNNELLKIRWAEKSIVWKSNTGNAPYGIAVANNKIYVSNWAGSIATDSTKERAGVPWGLAYTDPRTGATATGTVSVFEQNNGKIISEMNVGLHPNAIKCSEDGKYIYVSNGSSDQISVIQTKTNKLIETIAVGLLAAKDSLPGSTPNALELNDNILYVANGFNNAVAVVQLGKNAATNGRGKSVVTGFIPTEAFPGGLKIYKNLLVVTNLESNGSNVIDARKKARTIHQQIASVSIIPIPDAKDLEIYTQQVIQLNLANRVEQMQLAPRENIAALPVPERLGEPSVFKHVIYIIKENKTYDQVFGDLPRGRNDSTLCVFGEKVTPNQHALAKEFGWMDDYYASGKSSAEGHQWTDAGMVSDYVEKMVRAWFRSYPHRQADALVYNKNGFIWNQALDHGKSVRIYGEACETMYDTKRKWADLYRDYTNGINPNWHNSSSIARIRPIISATYPDCDNINFTDQQRASIFLEDWKNYEAENNLPNLLVLSLPNDHSAGTSPGFPTPNAMVADNDLAVGRIVEAISKSKYWDSTAIFITEDDSQGGWDHISSYRTLGLVISAYSNGKLVTTNYNQTSMLRTIEQILGLPPMNIVDASARLMTDCFQKTKNNKTYTALANNVPLNEMNPEINALSGKAKKFALQSKNEVFKDVDGGDDDKMNRIIWFYARGNKAYPSR